MNNMKSLILLSAVILIFVFYSFIGENISLISYVESSSGLQTISMESGRTELKLADINSDGYKDLLSIGDHGNPYVNTQEHGIMIWFGNGTGSNWSLFQYGNFGYGGIAIGDVNNDGKMDVGLGMHHNYATSGLGTKILDVGLGDGSGMNWVAYNDSLAANGETWGMFNTDFADVDNDGLLDIGSVSFGCCAGVHIYKNLGTGTWRQTFGFTGGNATNMEFVFGDIDNDGNIDFVVSHQYGTPYFGNGTGNFTLKHNNLPSPGTSGLKGVSLGDVDNDGEKELAFIGSSGGVQVWKWIKTTQQWVNLSANLPVSGSFEITRIVDMNMDGFADVVAFGAGMCKIFAGNGGTSWSE
ncbi:VCBS repeat-containing protein, partial [bacterium]